MPTEAELELIQGLRRKRKVGRPRRATLTVGIAPTDRCLLDEEAKVRGTTAKTLARKVLHVVLSEQLVRAVLDDA
jgi:hypothetical protein